MNGVNKKKIIVVTIILIIIVIALYFIFKKPKVEDKKTIEEPLAIVFPLKKGSTGTGVIAVQKYLNGKYNAGLTPDGSWGPVTDAAVMAHLKRDNISADVYLKWGLGKYL